LISGIRAPVKNLLIAGRERIDPFADRDVETEAGEPRLILRAIDCAHIGLNAKAL
jgi:hypothetical protein